MSQKFLSPSLNHYIICSLKLKILVIKSMFLPCLLGPCNNILKSMEYLLQGKDLYNGPPCTHFFRSAHFYIENISTFVTEQVTFMRRSTVLSLSPAVSVPWLNLFVVLPPKEPRQVQVRLMLHRRKLRERECNLRSTSK